MSGTVTTGRRGRHHDVTSRPSSEEAKASAESERQNALLEEKASPPSAPALGADGLQSEPTDPRQRVGARRGGGLEARGHTNGPNGTAINHN
ncbi:hypothetical protein EYF80_029817 [Liparis tanakae]|uniref:Uncharacterized protein n=1 Tax=Liparis tanakae TaxID=230148 RepID=A0A4Z2H3U8_9TELE|nr:hypothetical protein EYF80_029817 [Liparis tanakae]